MLRIFKSLVVIFFILFSVQDVKAQYVNVDSLVILPGHEAPVLVSDFLELMEELHFEELPFGQELFFGQHIPAGNMLRHFVSPSDGKVISRYGWRSGRMHTGTDLKMAKGDTIYAAFHGTVTRAKYFYGYGNMVVIDHGNNIETCYAHLSAFLVKTGDVVHKLQPVGLAGNTGRASTNHLHFELKEAGRHFDPELVFDFDNDVVREEVFAIRSLSYLLSDKNQPVFAYDEASPQSYIVNAGDSLWKISRMYRVSVKTLCLINNITENSVLQVGMVLKLF